MRGTSLLKFSRLAGLLLALPLFASAAGEPPAKDDKPAKEAKDDKPATTAREPADDEGGGFTFRLVIAYAPPKKPAKDAPKEAPLPAPKETPADTPKEGDKPADKPADKPKEEAVPAPTPAASAAATGGGPMLQRYAEVLKSDNVLVRKRAALILMTLGPDAFPPLLAQATLEQDPALKRLLIEKVTGGELFSTPEKVRSMLKVLADGSAEPGPRQLACQALTNLYPSRFTDATLKLKIKMQLEGAIADGSAEVQAAAAVALERIELLDSNSPAASQVNAPQTIRLHLDLTVLRSLRRKPEEIVQAIQAMFPPAKPRLVEEGLIECSLNEIERALLLERLYVPDKSGMKLKDLARIEVLKGEK
jgi:outer membrane biosynthesis protein TonB